MKKYYKPQYLYEPPPKVKAILLMLDNIKQHEIEHQIIVREKLISEMVGTLYPSVLRGEIDKLKSRRGEFLSEKDMNIK